MDKIIVFVISLIAVLLMLLMERVAGIGWDFHPDSVTYATTSEDVVNAIINNNYAQFFNNSYYFWAYAFGMNVNILTALNMIMFSCTNVIIFTFHQQNIKAKNLRDVSVYVIAFLLFNPYRMHLATTILKDTAIIMITCMTVAWRFRLSIWTVPALISIRVASLFYMSVYLTRTQLIILFAAAMMIAAVFSDALTQTLLDFNSSDMQLREFDTIPTFQGIGILGVLARAITWPIFAVTGAFAVISPAPAFVPVAVGSVLNQLYCYFTVRRLSFPLAVFVPMAIFGALVTGYTSYLRYAYPLMVVLPLLALKHQLRVNRFEGNRRILVKYQ
jgi:hypothetical protein